MRILQAGGFSCEGEISKRLHKPAIRARIVPLRPESKKASQGDHQVAIRSFTRLRRAIRSGNRRFHPSLQPSPISRRGNRRRGSLRHDADGSYPTGRGNEKAKIRGNLRVAISVNLLHLRKQDLQNQKGIGASDSGPTDSKGPRTLSRISPFPPALRPVPKPVPPQGTSELQAQPIRFRPEWNPGSRDYWSDVLSKGSLLRMSNSGIEFLQTLGRTQASGSPLEGTPVPRCGVFRVRSQDRPPSSGKWKTFDKENLPYFRIWKSLTYSNRLRPALGRLYKGNRNPKAKDRHFKTWRLGLDDRIGVDRRQTSTSIDGLQPEPIDKLSRGLIDDTYRVGRIVHAMRIMTHEELAARHPHPPSPFHVNIDRQIELAIDRQQETTTD
ncbi:hypothetical protein F2Q69_00042908 [Brassica cretica]|uniref:Uncharacterized protein n=1 Tax=Brassica cretica TaxID=69181 RepID=A0A8S9N6G0_BRACR|nr:hypothetical protein F2Q69_00042908 [Brassica cretica]